MSNPRSETRGDRPAMGDRILLARPMATTVDWAAWLRILERKRRALATNRPSRTPLAAGRTTLSSFRLEGIDVSDADLEDAHAPSRGGRAFRSRLRQRVRNHLAILLAIERSLRRREALSTAQVLRWYTSISSGLSTSALASLELERIEAVVRRINSPQMRLQPAIQEIAHLHCDLLADAVFPSFNGILARLLLQVHLGHCGLPMVRFDPSLDPPRFAHETLLLPRLLELIDQGFEMREV